MNSANAYIDGWRDGLRLPEAQTVSEWADAHRILSRESSAEPGRWDTDRAPYQREVMDCYSDDMVRSIVMMFSAQTGKTEMINNMIGFQIANDPCPILLIQPTLEIAEAWSKDRLAPMLRDTPALQGKVEDARARDSGNTVRHKIFPGGHITMAGANSPASLASRPVRITVFDEVDRYPPSAGTEGDPVSLGRKRSTTFYNRKSVMASTPTIKNASRIESEYLISDMRQYWVPCPHCGKHQVLKWGKPEEAGGVRWAKGDAKNAWYECEHCRKKITDADKPEMLRGGEWRARGTFNGIAGFHLSELYSPWVSWGEMAVTFLEAKKLPETFKTFVNTALAETWEERGDDVDSDVLLKRRENYGPALPLGVVFLTAGIDVQDDRIEAELVGWGADQESWSIEYQVFTGDPARPEVWQALDDGLLSSFAHESGLKFRIAAAGIDSGGHHTQQTYRFCKARFGRRVLALKGTAGGGKALVSKARRPNSVGIRLNLVGVDTAKELIYSRLRIREAGAGFCHFPAHYDANFFEQLTAEKVVTKYVNGFAARVWMKKTAHARNEALDCRVYALAALELCNVDLSRIANRMAARVEHGQGERAEAKAAPEDDRPVPPARPTAQPLRRRRGGFVRRY